ncbi:Thymosin beta [Dirofilaria immitis]
MYLLFDGNNVFLENAKLKYAIGWELNFESPTKKRVLKLPLDIATEVTKGQKLKHVEIDKKSILPIALDLYREKKNILPTSNDIAREKVSTLIVNFDAEKLKHVESIVKMLFEIKKTQN